MQQVEVKPGFSESSELIFKGQGHQAPNQDFSDLVIKFKQVESDCYQRLGHNLVLTHKISLLDVFQKTPCAFRTMDGRALTIAIDE